MNIIDQIWISAQNFPQLLDNLLSVLLNWHMCEFGQRKLLQLLLENKYPILLEVIEVLSR